MKHLTPAIIALALFGFLATCAHGIQQTETEFAKQYGEGFVACINKGGKFVDGWAARKYSCDLPASPITSRDGS